MDVQKEPADAIEAVSTAAEGPKGLIERFLPDVAVAAAVAFVVAVLAFGCAVVAARRLELNNFPDVGRVPESVGLFDLLKSLKLTDDGKRVDMREFVGRCGLVLLPVLSLWIGELATWVSLASAVVFVAFTYGPGWSVVVVVVAAGVVMLVGWLLNRWLDGHPGLRVLERRKRVPAEDFRNDVKSSEVVMGSRNWRNAIVFLTRVVRPIGAVVGELLEPGRSHKGCHMTSVKGARGCRCCGECRIEGRGRGCFAF